MTSIQAAPGMVQGGSEIPSGISQQTIQGYYQVRSIAFAPTSQRSLCSFHPCANTLAAVQTDERAGCSTRRSRIREDYHCPSSHFKTNRLRKAKAATANTPNTTVPAAAAARTTTTARTATAARTATTTTTATAKWQRSAISCQWNQWYTYPYSQIATVVNGLH